jgi:hypothetical protein
MTAQHFEGSADVLKFGQNHDAYFRNLVLVVQSFDLILTLELNRGMGLPEHYNAHPGSESLN